MGRNVCTEASFSSCPRDIESVKRQTKCCVRIIRLHYPIELNLSIRDDAWLISWFLTENRGKIENKRLRILTCGTAAVSVSLKRVPHSFFFFPKLVFVRPVGHPNSLFSLSNRIKTNNSATVHRKERDVYSIRGFIHCSGQTTQLLSPDDHRKYFQ